MAGALASNSRRPYSVTRTRQQLEFLDSGGNINAYARCTHAWQMQALEFSRDAI
jgi:hypothetical protein